MVDQKLKVLLIEDNSDHAKLVQRHLDSVKNQRIQMERVARLADGLERLENGGIDAVLLDLGLPDSSAGGTLESVLAKAPDAAVIVLTALDDLELAITAVQNGAQDYLVKADITGELLTRAIRYAIERRRYAAELERSNREFEEFAHVVSHELKTPLWVVAYCCDHLDRKYSDRLSSETRDFVKSAVNSVRRMNELINDLLEYARVGSRRQPSEPTSATRVIQEVLDVLQVEIQQSGAAVVCQDLPTVLVDPRQLSQVFHNLIANSIKYRGPEPPRVHISAEPDGKFWVFHVRDNGIGIAAEHNERIFNVFERLHTEEEYAGTGIGLAICKKVIEGHGGRIWVESEVGRGSVFSFSLPAA